MSDPLPEHDGHGRYRRIVAVVGGGYLRNTIREPGGTCAVCTTPIEPCYSHYIRCREHMITTRDRQQGLARLVGPLVYGVAGTQSGTS